MDAIFLRGVRTHNLKNLDIILSHGKLYVITGVSGSGKSSLAFDTLYAEGQRRYVESLSAYARQFLERMEKPDVESVTGIPPAIAIEAKNVVTNARSTVGTQTEINDYLRVLFARIGRTICPDCKVEVGKSEPADISRFLEKDYAEVSGDVLFPLELGKKGKKYLKEFLPELERQGFQECLEGNQRIPLEKLLAKKNPPESIAVLVDSLKFSAKNRKRLIDSLESARRFGRGQVQIAVKEERFRFSEGFRCYRCFHDFREPTPNLFSFNSPLGACPECQGFGRVITLDWNLVVPDINKTIYQGAVEPWTKPSSHWEFQQLLKFCRKKKIPVDRPWKSLTERHKKWILEGTGGDDYFSVRDFFDYLERKTYKMHVRIFLAKYRQYVPCPVCRETRLKPEALAVKVSGKNVFEIQQMNILELFRFVEQLQLDPAEKKRVEPVYLELKKRVRFLKEVGLGYLTLARLSRTLSGGEVQRIHLATSLGSALVDTLYVLDEPSIGLHERDNELLIRLLRELRELGNTVVVVEHDKTMIESADEVLDLGPGGGENGGRLLFQGTVHNLRKSGTLTGDYLSGKKEVKRRKGMEREEAEQWISIYGASEHNLKNIDVRFPLRRFVALTGVSGSGKSTLLYEILYRHYQRYRGRPVQDLGKVSSVEGFDGIQEMVLVDQTPIGRTPRSNPVTYLKAYDEIRKVFARTPAAKRLGFEPGHFSFNVDGGRCEICKGDGKIKIEMHFLADVYITCESCRGTRFKDELLEIQYRDKNIAEVLDMTAEEAMFFFEEEPKVVDKLNLLSRVGLGYLKLGQPATTLSGGEAQRLKLASEISDSKSGPILYLFDEPTTGLHYHDIHYLIEAFEGLLAKGHSLFIIEHNMEVIRAADYIIDLGPEGGHEGGEVVYQGPLQNLCRVKSSYTGQFLGKHTEKAGFKQASI